MRLMFLKYAEVSRMLGVHIQFLKSSSNLQWLPLYFCVFMSIAQDTQQARCRK